MVRKEGLHSVTAGVLKKRSETPNDSPLEPPGFIHGETQIGLKEGWKLTSHFSGPYRDCYVIEKDDVLDVFDSKMPAEAFVRNKAKNGSDINQWAMLANHTTELPRREI
jgi:hypothetical protein